MAFPANTPHLLTFQLNAGVNLTVVRQDLLQLSDDEWRFLKEQLRMRLRQPVEELILTRYKEILQLAISKKPMPRP